jgi:excisionase family DNA binding protein
MQATVKANGDWTNKQGIAARYGCSLRHIGNLTKTRKLPYVKLGRIVRFNVADCDRAIKAFEIKSVGSFQSFSE